MHNCHIVAAEVRDRDGEEREGEILKGTPISGEKKKIPGGPFTETGELNIHREIKTNPILSMLVSRRSHNQQRVCG